MTKVYPLISNRLNFGKHKILGITTDRNKVTLNNRIHVLLFFPVSGFQIRTNEGINNKNPGIVQWGNACLPKAELKIIVNKIKNGIVVKRFIDL